MVFKRYLLLVFLTITTVFVLKAQTITNQLAKNKPLHQFNFTPYNTSNNLPTNSVLQIIQSSQGYIYISSYAGLIQFDGKRFVMFNKKNTPAFKSNITGRIKEDHFGTIWITTQGSGLISYNEGKFKSHGINQGIENIFRAIYIDSANNIWSASPQKGWFIYDGQQFEFLKWHKPLQDIEVRTIEEGPDKAIYFGTLGHGIFVFKDGKLNQIPPEHYNNALWVYTIFRCKNNQLWFGTSQGLFLFDGKQFKQLDIPNIATVNSITQDSTGNIWIGASSGLFRIDSETMNVEHLDKALGLPSCFINSLTFDHEGSLWLTNYKGGIIQIKDGMFVNYHQSVGLRGKVVNSVVEVDPKHFLIGFDNGAIDQIENGRIKPFQTKHNLRNSRIRHILKDSQKNLWISSYNGLLKIEPNGKEYFFHPKNGFPSSKIRLTYEDSEQNLWIGTRNHGLLKMDLQGTIKIFDNSSGFNSLLVMSINEYKGKIYVGTNDGGLYIFENDTVIQVLDKTNGLPSNIVFNTYMDAELNLWIAMNGGLVHVKNDTIRFLTVNDGLEDDSPFDVLEDNWGNLWLPSASGIMKLNKNELLNHFNNNAQNQINCILYTQKDGMQHEECNANAMSIKASDGTLLFPTIEGVVQVNPGIKIQNTKAPNVIIENLFVNNQPVDLHQPIIIPPGKNRLTFEYTALSLLEPQKNQFKYQLVGYDDNFVDAKETRTVSFTNLAPGSYTFKVIASNNQDVWNFEGDSVYFTIKPRFFQTYTFYGLLGVFLLGLVFLIYKIRVRQYKYRQQILEALVKRRTHQVMLKNKTLEEQKQEIQSQAEKLAEQKEVLEKLNTDKDKMFSIVAHDLRSPMGNFKAMLENLSNKPELYDDNRRQKVLQALNEMAKNTYDLLENLLNWSKTQMGVINFEPDKIEILPIVKDVLKLAEPLAQKKNIAIKIKIPPTLTVYADANMVRTIFRNLIMNAIKFTDMLGNIEVTSMVIENSVQFSVKDNGVGLTPQIQEKLFTNKYLQTSLGTHNEKGSGLGLLLCKEFVSINRGNIWVESVFGKGTTFHFTLPAKPESD
jgi:signal transduction histidine kinase/ligand-binding sensor domain-containing protein